MPRTTVAVNAPGPFRAVWATPSRWPHLETLFGERGACGGCWCMVWRLERSEWLAGKGPGNRKALRSLVEGGKKPGVIAYLGREAVAWCAVAPRREYGFLGRSRILAPVDESEVWSISCLFVRKAERRKGISTRLLRETALMAIRRGARAVEAYPVEPAMAKTPDAFLWTGIPSAYRKAGFREVARRSPSRPILRFLPPRPRAR